MYIIHRIYRKKFCVLRLRIMVYYAVRVEEIERSQVGGLNNIRIDWRLNEESFWLVNGVSPSPLLTSPGYLSIRAFSL